MLIYRLAIFFPALVMIVAGGESGGFVPSNTSEIVDMHDPSRVCNSPIPVPVFGDVGGVVNNVPMVCGRNIINPNYTGSCYKFNTGDYTWTYSHEMITGRLGSASASFHDHLWVTGGYYKKSTEYVTLSGSSPGPDLPSQR